MEKSTFEGRWISIKVSEQEYQRLIQVYERERNQRTNTFKGIFWGRYLMSRSRAREIVHQHQPERLDGYFFRFFDIFFLLGGIIIGLVAGKMHRNAS